MKNIKIAGLILVGSLLCIHNAAAFSVDNDSSQSINGQQKFTDPDEQMPGFVASPNEAQMRNRMLSNEPPSVTMPTVGDTDDGARAFDQAFSHQQDKE